MESPLGGSWYVAIRQSRKDGHECEAAEVEEVPWEYYQGRVDRGEFSLQDGDRPEVYVERRREAMMKRKDWLTLGKAAEYFKTKYCIVIKPGTVRNWINGGRKSIKSGFRVKLKGQKKYNKWYTTEKWVEDFVKAVGEYDI